MREKLFIYDAKLLGKLCETKHIGTLEWYNRNTCNIMVQMKNGMKHCIYL